jgi:hypothetical protein
MHPPAIEYNKRVGQPGKSTNDREIYRPVATPAED